MFKIPGCSRSELLRSVLGFRPCADVVSPGEAKVATSSVCWGIFSFQIAQGQTVPLLLERLAHLRWIFAHVENWKRRKCLWNKEKKFLRKIGFCPKTLARMIEIWRTRRSLPRRHEVFSLPQSSQRGLQRPWGGRPWLSKLAIVLQASLCVRSWDFVHRLDVVSYVEAKVAYPRDPRFATNYLVIK